MMIDKLEKFACFEKEDLRVVSVDVKQTFTSDNYAQTTIVINSLNDDIAHQLDGEKWRDGNLEMQLIKAIDDAERRVKQCSLILFD